MFLQICPKMNFAHEVKGCTRRSAKIQSIHSAAETELGRKLAQDEMSFLSKKFSVKHIHDYVQKVYII